MPVSLPHVSGNHIERRAGALAMLLVLALALELAAGAGLAYVAGFSSVRAVLGHSDWVWLTAAAGSLGVSFAGYYHAYEGMFTVAGRVRADKHAMPPADAAGPVALSGC